MFCSINLLEEMPYSLLQPRTGKIGLKGAGITIYYIGVSSHVIINLADSSELM